MRPNGFPGRYRSTAGVAAALLLLLATSALPGVASPTGPGRPNALRLPPSSRIATDAGAPGTVRAARLVSTPLRPHPGFASVSATSTWLTYDPYDDLFFIAVDPDVVDVVPGAVPESAPVIDSIPVGNDPFDVAYGAANDIFVTNNGSNNVSVIHVVLSRNYTAVDVASVPVGSNPTGEAYDPTDGELFVANEGSDTVSAISGATDRVNSTIPVGPDPIGVAYDPSSGDVLVADHGSSNLTVISASSHRVVGNLSLAAGARGQPGAPYDIAVDTADSRVYVTDEGARAISVINATTLQVLSNVSVDDPGYTVDLQGIAYDSGDGQVYAGGGALSLVVLEPNGSVKFANMDPSGVAYDPQTGAVCVTNTANQTFECATFYTGPPSGPYRVSFQETGLAKGTDWGVALDGGYNSSTGTSVDFSLPDGTYPFDVEVGYGAPGVPQPVGGLVTVDGASVVYPITVGPVPTYTVRFDASGLPNLPDPWVVIVTNSTDPDPYTPNTDNVSESSTNWTAVPLRNGTYEFSVPEVAGYVATPWYGWFFTVRGSSVLVPFTFVPPAPADYPVIFSETGLATGNGWSVTLSEGASETGTSSGTSLRFNLTNGSYEYSVWAGGYDAYPSDGSFNVSAGPVSLSVAFVGTEEYQLEFQETGLPKGTGWAVLIGNQSQSSLTPNVTFVEPNGTYGYLIVLVSGYQAVGYGTAVINGSNTLVSVKFRPQLYPVVFVEFGLPAGANWSVTVVNVTLGINETQNSTGDSITFYLPNGTYQAHYTLPAGYTGNVSSATITVAGRAETGGTLSASGHPPGGYLNSTPRSSPGTPGAVGEVPLWVLGAVVAGFVVAIVLALVVARGRRPPPPADPLPP